MNLFNPSAIVLGGYFAPLAEWLVEGVEREVGVHVLGARWSGCRVLASRLGEDAAVRGAAARVLHDVLADPASVGWSSPRDPRRRPRRQRLSGAAARRLPVGLLDISGRRN